MASTTNEYRDFSSWLGFLGKKDERPILNNTTVRRTACGQVAVKLHHTDVVTYTGDGQIILKSGGYATPTTLNRLNRFIPAWAHVYQKDFQWYVVAQGHWPMKFYDGIRLDIRSRTVLYSE